MVSGERQYAVRLRCHGQVIRLCGGKSDDRNLAVADVEAAFAEGFARLTAEVEGTWADGEDFVIFEPFAGPPDEAGP